MNLVAIIAACAFLPLGALSILRLLSMLFGWLSGFHKLLKVYSWYGTTPPNTSRSIFFVGIFMDHRARVGASEHGLYLHRGLIFPRSVCIPWHELQPVFELWPIVVLRERRTNVLVSVFQGAVASQKPSPML